MASEQSPLDQARERLAEAVPTKYLPGLAALQNLRAIWSDHRGRTRDAHRAAAKAAGMEDCIGQDGVDDMGDISVAGDSSTKTMHYHYGQGGGAIAGKLLTALLAGGLGAAGLFIWQQLHQQPAPPASPVPPFVAPPLVDSEYEVRFYDAQGRLIDVPHISQRPAAIPPAGATP